MKSIVLFFLLILIVLVASNDQEFNKWHQKFRKLYVSVSHRIKAATYFKITDDRIKKHNLKYERNETLSKTIHNRLSDISDEQFEKLMIDFEALAKKRPSTRSGVTNIKVPRDWNPTKLDLRTDRIPVKDQGSICGSCWTFSAMALLEYKLLQDYDEYYDLSEQTCVDCTGDNGCKGGFPKDCFDYLLKNGINYETYYPYVEKYGRCSFRNPGSNSKYGLGPKYARKWYNIPGDEKLMAYIMEQHGYVSACLNSKSVAFRNHESGIILEKDCDKKPTHAIVLVGYGSKNGVKYWIGKNSWADWWGDNGHFKLERGVNACGIAGYDEIYRTFLV